MFPHYSIGIPLLAARTILLRTERDRPSVLGITQMTIPEKVVCMPNQYSKSVSGLADRQMPEIDCPAQSLQT